jgi:predicted nucleic acid-binding protein
MDLARRLGLITYDAAYLELAKRRSVPLATLDESLRRACAVSRIAVLP